jgi:SAM-dependent methyltransferase
MTPNDSTTIHDEVRNHYGEVARKGSSCCGPACCTPQATGSMTSASETALRLGYTPQELGSVPEGANLGLGCGNPQAIAALRRGETVVDLGSGAGFDCLLAARQVGPDGKVIGVDMTPDMISRARQNAARTGAANVEFRLGEIEHLPVPDRSADAIISNCVINLSPDKAAVFREALRVLRPGGRLAISDVVALGPMPENIQRDLAMYTGCVAGAATVEETTRLLTEAGFVDIEVTIDQAASQAMADLTPGHDLRSLAASARIEARRPGEGMTA